MKLIILFHLLSKLRMRGALSRLSQRIDKVSESRWSSRKTQHSRSFNSVRGDRMGIFTTKCATDPADQERQALCLQDRTSAINGPTNEPCFTDRYVPFELLVNQML